MIPPLNLLLIALAAVVFGFLISFSMVNNAYGGIII